VKKCGNPVNSLHKSIQSCLSVMQLADFGLSTTFGHGHLLKTYCGSPLYASPEIVNARPYIGPEVRLQSDSIFEKSVISSFC